MRNWIALFLAAVLPASGSSTLYDDLRRPATSVEQFDHPSDPFEDMLSPNFQQYKMNGYLKEAFVVLNVDDDKDYVPEYYNVNEALPYRYRLLIEDSIYLQFLMISVVAALTVMPESVTKWDPNELKQKSLGERWTERVNTKPVWDQDDWTINYIGHPISGAIYYTMARNDGMSIFESAAYSTLMSTFFWEYGYEAFAEIPSIQDLILTPLIGSFLGEGMHVLEGKLDRQGGMIWGSRVLGNISYFFLDPMGNIATGMNNLLLGYNNKVTVTMTLQSYPLADDISQFRFTDPVDSPQRFHDRDYGFLITLQ